MWVRNAMESEVAMRNESLLPRRPWTRVVGAVATVLALNGCGVDKVEIPEFDGPAELGLSVSLTASPDILTADGFSSSLVQATVRDQNGAALSGRQIFVAITDQAGRTADIGNLRSTSGSGLGTGLVLTTGANGIAQASYEAPPRTDFTNNSSVLVTARPVGTDYNGQVYRSVRIELRSAEPRLFPQVPGNVLPFCGFVVEAVTGTCGVPLPAPSTSPAPSPAPAPTPSPNTPTICTVRANTTVLFQSTSRDNDGQIVRYEWFFGDGTRDDKPDLAKVYRFTGTFNVTHVVTDNGGGQSACQTTLTVVP
jgi:PKD domain-containing protein